MKNQCVQINEDFTRGQVNGNEMMRNEMGENRCESKSSKRAAELRCFHEPGLVRCAGGTARSAKMTTRRIARASLSVRRMSHW